MERKIPKKNYIILAIVVIITVALVFYIRDWYITTNEYYAENSTIKDVSREIREDEISNYTVESGKFAIYTSDGSNLEIKDFESDLKNAIKETNSQNNILYLNTNELDINNFCNTLKNNFSKNNEISEKIISDSQATLYIFEEGKITQVYSNLNNYTLDDLKKIIKKEGLADNA